jgi:hypothetical protein
MKLFKIKGIAMMGALSIAGVGLIGVGAHATFVAQTQSSQSVTAGNIAITLASTDAGASGSGTPTLTLPAVTNVASSFMSTPELITINNSGSLPANEIQMQATNSGSSAVASEMSMCLYSDGYVTYNGTIANFVAAGQFGWVGPVPAGGSDTYWVVFYAGSQATGCGNTTGIQNVAYPVAGNSNAGTLQNDSEGGSADVTITIIYNG